MNHSQCGLNPIEPMVVGLLKGAALGFVFGCIWFVTGTLGWVSGREGFQPPDPRFLPFSYVAFGISALLFALSRFTDNYYLLDRAQRRVIYHFQFLFLRTIRVVLRNVAAVTVCGKSSKHEWYYHVVAVDTAGRMVRLTDPVNNLEVANGIGQRLATALTCAFHPSPPESKAVIRATNGSLAITFAPTIF